MKFEMTDIESICRDVYSGGTPKSNVEEYYKQGTIPWLNTKEVNFNRIRKTERLITQLGFEDSSAKWVESPAVVVAMYGATAGNVATIHCPITTNQACCNLIIDENKADFRFVYYYLKWKYLELASLANGGAQQNLNAKLIKSFPVNLPDIITQKKIANILWNIDDKIEVNCEINKNLEIQVRSAFRKWNNNSDSVEEWINLAEIVNFNSETYSPKEKWDYINYLDTSNIKAGVMDEVQYIRAGIDKLPSRARRKVQDGDIIYSTVRPNQLHYGMISKTMNNMLVSTGFTVIRSTVKGVSNELIYLCLTEPAFVEQMQQIAEQSTSAYPSIRPADLGNCLIPVPKDAGDDFNLFLKNVYAVIDGKYAENRNLSNLRDTLMLGLMSGDIDVSNINL